MLPKLAAYAYLFFTSFFRKEKQKAVRKFCYPRIPNLVAAYQIIVALIPRVGLQLSCSMKITYLIGTMLLAESLRQRKTM